MWGVFVGDYLIEEPKRDVGVLQGAIQEEYAEVWRRWRVVDLEDLGVAVQSG